MKTTLYRLLLFALTYTASPVIAQTTNIPDPNFEEALIDLGIDSDGIINGQVLNSDVENVTALELSIFNNIYGIQDLTGLEGFINLEELSVVYMEITELDISHNLQLKYLNCSNNFLSSLDVSNNTLLEYLDIGNNGLDVGPYNYFEEIDLSHNPNIKTLYAVDLYGTLARINLKNGNNNPDMYINFRLYPDTASPDFDPEYNFVNVCIEVDDAAAALNNEFPYSAWNIVHNYAAYNFSDVCNLGREESTANKFTIYPNPASDLVYIKANGNPVDMVVVYDCSGRVVRNYNNPAQKIYLDGLPKGLYLVKVISGKDSQCHKLLVN